MHTIQCLCLTTIGRVITHGIDERFLFVVVHYYYHHYYVGIGFRPKRTTTKHNKIDDKFEIIEYWLIDIVFDLHACLMHFNPPVLCVNTFETELFLCARTFFVLKTNRRLVRCECAQIPRNLHCVCSYNNKIKNNKEKQQNSEQKDQNICVPNQNAVIRINFISNTSLTKCNGAVEHHVKESITVQCYLCVMQKHQCHVIF